MIQLLLEQAIAAETATDRGGGGGVMATPTPPCAEQDRPEKITGDLSGLVFVHCGAPIRNLQHYYPSKPCSHHRIYLSLLSCRINFRQGRNQDQLPLLLHR